MPCMFDQRRSRDRVKPHPLRKPIQERQPSMVVRVDLLQGNNIGIKLRSGHRRPDPDVLSIHPDTTVNIIGRKVQTHA